jgi:hypothetical protein
MLLENFGFTYVTNPGIYISHNISEVSIFLLQILVLFSWLLVFWLFNSSYKLLKKNSLIIDLCFAFLTTGLISNLIFDRIMFGYIRDYLIIPMGIANIADFCGLIAFILFTLEIVRSTEFRSILIGKYKTQSIVLESK